MRKSEIIKKYKKDRNIQDNYKLDEDEMYLVEEIQKALNFNALNFQWQILVNKQVLQ